MVDRKKKYSWRLVGPWYRKNSVGGGKGFSGRPIIQKYASSDFINDFLEDPQRSLHFVAEDYIERPCENIYSPVTAAGQNNAIVKLFLDVHSRYYLIVCELHCQAPGFPKVDRDQVCEAGFVVRKIKPRYPDELQDDFNKRYAEKSFYVSEIQKNMSTLATLKNRAARADGDNPVLLKKIKSLNDTVKSLEKKLAGVEEQIKKLIQSPGVYSETMGWHQTEHKGIGYWEQLSSDTPQETDEEIMSLYPLIVDEDDKPEHPGGHQSIWFGLIPTYSADVDQFDESKYDDNNLYEIRCFVRRHKEGCPKKNSRNDCHGELVWSEATEVYKLAAPFDLDGSSHRPINIKLPDTKALSEQSKRRPFGAASNVRMIMPANANLGFTSDGVDLDEISQKKNSNQQICFFSIPLITIIALFVLNLFLPIVIFVLQLWFLLRLKFCIPPSIDFDADLAADLQLHGPDFEASLNAEVSIELGGHVYADVGAVATAITNEMTKSGNGFGVDMKAGYKSYLNNNFDEMAGISLDMTSDFSDDPDDERLAADLPTPANGLLFFEEVSV